MNDLRTNVMQAISDFDGIKAEIENCGIPVGFAPVEQYPDKIEQIGQTNENLHFTASGRPYVSHVVIPEGTTKIGRNAYDGCSGVTAVDIPASVTLIERSAFAGTGVQEIIIPNDDAELSISCFSNCHQLKSIKLPANLKQLPQFALYRAESLEELELPDGITQLGMSSINTCMKLRKIHFPASLQEITLNNLRYCGLEEAILPEGLLAIGTQVLRDCPNLKKVSLPASLTSIGSGFMQSNTNLEEVLLGRGFQVSLDISMSTKYTPQTLIDCIFNYADRSGQDALIFTMGATNLAKLDGVYVLETETGLDIVESTAAGAMLVADYAAGKNITLA